MGFQGYEIQERSGVCPLKWASTVSTSTGKVGFVELAATGTTALMEDEMDDLDGNFGNLDDLMGIKRTDLYKLAIPTGALLRLKLNGFGGLQHRLTVPWITLLAARMAMGTLLG